MDEFTQRHFAAWIEEQQIASTIEQKMREIFEEDAAWWANQSYWTLYDEAVRAMQLSFRG